MFFICWMTTNSRAWVLSKQIGSRYNHLFFSIILPSSNIAAQEKYYLHVTGEGVKPLISCICTSSLAMRVHTAIINTVATNPSFSFPIAGPHSFTLLIIFPKHTMSISQRPSLRVFLSPLNKAGYFNDYSTPLDLDLSTLPRWKLCVCIKAV